MTGLGYKDFVNGTVADASEADGYFMQQSIMRFASAAARDVALAGVVDTGMHAYTADTDMLWAYRGSAWREVWPWFVRKNANESVVGSTTMQNDDQLLLTVPANSKYLVRAGLFFQANNLNDGKVGWSLPSGTFNGLGQRASTSIGTGTTASTGDYAAVTGASSAVLNVGVTDGSTTIGAELLFLLEIGVTGGTANLQWAQLASGSTLTLLAGSWLEARRVA